MSIDLAFFIYTPTNQTVVVANPVVVANLDIADCIAVVVNPDIAVVVNPDIAVVVNPDIAVVVKTDIADCIAVNRSYIGRNKVYKIAFLTHLIRDNIYSFSFI
jgi:hypothetical protein